MLSKLRNVKLFLNIQKCDFSVKEVKYIGVIISTTDLKIDQSKVHTIQNWKIPCYVKDVQFFLGFANFYRRFIAGYSEIAAPFIKTVEKSFIFL